MSETMGSKTQKVVALFGNLVAVMSEKYSLVEHEHAIEGGLGGKPASLVWGFGWSDKAALRVSFGPSPSAPGPKVWSSLMPASLVEIAPHMPALVSALEKKVADVRAIEALKKSMNIMYGRAGARSESGPESTGATSVSFPDPGVFFVYRENGVTGRREYWETDLNDGAVWTQYADVATKLRRDEAEDVCMGLHAQQAACDEDDAAATVDTYYGILDATGKLGMLKYVNGNFEPAAAPPAPAATPPEPVVAARPAPETSEALKVGDFTFVVCRTHSAAARQYIMRYHGARPLWTHDIGSAMVFPEADARAECKDAHRRGAPSDEIPWTYGVMGKPAPMRLDKYIDGRFESEASALAAAPKEAEYVTYTATPEAAPPKEGATYATYARAELAKGSGLTASSTVSSATAAENVRSLAVFRLLPWEGREFWGHPTKGWVRNPMDAIALSLEEAKARLAVLRTASTAKLGYTYGAMNIPTMQIAIDAAP